MTQAELPEVDIRVTGSLNDFANYGSGGGEGGWSSTSMGANDGQGRLQMQGGGGAHNNLQPQLDLNQIIKT